MQIFAVVQILISWLPESKSFYQAQYLEIKNLKIQQRYLLNSLFGKQDKYDCKQTHGQICSKLTQ